MTTTRGTGVFDIHLPDIVEAKVVELVQDKTARNIFRVVLARMRKHLKLSWVQLFQTEPAGVFKALEPVIAGVLGIDVARRDPEDLILEMTFEITSRDFQELVEGCILLFDRIILIMVMFAKIAVAKPGRKAARKAAKKAAKKIAKKGAKKGQPTQASTARSGSAQTATPQARIEPDMAQEHTAISSSADGEKQVNRLLGAMWEIIGPLLPSR
ncbi:hypothetical protein GE09DRAFT_1230931 [Coniochaeta sp. 2T2.1]|nr:hypothetical protein GE09DRAFT_1230931 [Coniochaeta sp. 2T2.1]